MKKLSKVLVLVLSAIMVLAMSASVFADTTVTIDPQTPEGSTGSAPTYTYYKMMEASVGTAGTSYFVENEALATALDGLKVGDDDLFTVKKASGANKWTVTINEKYKDDGESVATALQSIKDKAIATGTASNNQITLAKDGYLLVESSLGTNLVLDTVTTKTLKEKNTYPSVTKTASTTNAEIGQAVTYTIPVVIPASVAEKKITVTDKMSKGLTMNTAITADNDVTGLVWTLKETATDGTKTYTVDIPAATVKALAGKTLTLTYTATVNELAVKNNPETNTAGLEYDNFTSKDTPDVEVKTFGFDLLKTDGTNALPGVKFTLQNSAKEYYTVPTDEESVDEDRFVAAKSELTTGSDGKIEFVGLAAGDYTLTETETVDGYNLLEGPVVITVANDGTATIKSGDATIASNLVTVVNKAGTVLPSTGGIGTTIFYILGSLLVVGCGIVLISRKRTESHK